MAVRKASAVWNGTLKEGKGYMKLGSGAFEGRYTFSSRFEEDPGTPRKSWWCSHAGCFSITYRLSSPMRATPTEICTNARVHLGEGPRITLIELDTEAEVPDLDEKTFLENVEGSKHNCPVSMALTGPTVRVAARLIK